MSKIFEKIASTSAITERRNNPQVLLSCNKNQRRGA